MQHLGAQCAVRTVPAHAWSFMHVTSRFQDQGLCPSDCRVMDQQFDDNIELIRDQDLVGVHCIVQAGPSSAGSGLIVSLTHWPSKPQYVQGRHEGHRRKLFS